MEKRVAIVGAGISGLLACKYAASLGFSPVVFEEQENVGGLWNHTIESTRLQNARPTFEFSDFPWPSSVEYMFPTNLQVLEYLQSYAHYFELLPYINFNSKVIDIDYVGGESEQEMSSWELWGGAGNAFGSKGKWILRVFNKRDNSTKEYEAEFVMICIGRFSGLPNMPVFTAENGPEMFSGKVLHLMEYSAMDNAAAAELIKGKRVVVVGSGKSASDTAFECATANGIDYPCTMIQKTPHWALPDTHPWGVNFGFFFATRFSELMVHKPGEGFLSCVTATLLKPLMGDVEVRGKLHQMETSIGKIWNDSEESFLGEVTSCQIFMLPQTFYDKVENGSIVLRKSHNLSFCKQGLIIDGEDDHPIKADVVIFATGYKGIEKLQNIFKSPTFQNLHCRISNLHHSSLQMIHPRIPRVAVIGYSESTSNLFTFEMRCKWVAFFLDEAFHLPSIIEMEKDMEKWDKYMKTYAGNAKFRRACITGLHIWYIDQLCNDIGFNPRRKMGFFSELFQPYGLTDYNGFAPNSR